MALVSDVLNLILYDLLEDPGIGPLLGLFTQQQLIELLNLALQDFAQRTAGLYGYIYTQPVELGESLYEYPDQMQRADLAFLGGKLLKASTVASLNQQNKNWRTTEGLPTDWHQDQLPIQTIELADIPNYNSAVFTPQQTFVPVINGVPTPPDQAGALTIVGPAAPQLVAAVTDPIPGLDDDWALTAVSFALLARLFSSDSELKDNSRAQWCQEQFDVLCAVGASVPGEPSPGQQ